MPAGSGPYVSAPVTAGSITAVANAFTLASPVGNWLTELGILITVTLFWTLFATQTITVKLYQGAGVAGTQVAPVAGLVATGTGTTEQEATFTFVDTSAYALGLTQAGLYTAGFTASTGTGAVAYAFTELETIAPLQ